MTAEFEISDRPLKVIARKILGLRVAEWSEQKAIEQTESWNRTQGQLMDLIANNRLDLDRIMTDDLIPPDGVEPEQYRQDEIARVTCQLEKAISMMERLNSIWMKLSGGGAVAMLGSLQRASTLAQLSASIRENGNGERNATPRRRFGAGAAMVDV